MRPALPLLALLIASPADAGGLADPAPQRGPSHVTIHQRIIIRVVRTPLPAGNRVSAPLLEPVGWAEKNAPKCVPTIQLAAVAITRSDSVDLVLNGGKRMRARLGKRCPALGFYGGIYLRPTEDGMVCQGRDSILSRSGGACRIERFRMLVPKP